MWCEGLFVSLQPHKPNFCIMNKIIMKTVVLSRFLCYLPSSVIATSVKRLNSIYMLLALFDIIASKNLQKSSAPFSFFFGRHTNQMLRGIVELVKTFYRASCTWRLSPYLHDAPCFTLLYIQTNQNLHIHHHPGQTSQASRL